MWAVDPPGSHSQSGIGLKANIRPGPRVDCRSCGMSLLGRYDPARSGEQILTWQARQTADSLTGLNRWVLRILRIDIARSQRKAFARLKAGSANVVRMQGRRINAAWMREFLDYDPAIDLAHIEVPVLAITGDRDIQTDPDDLDRMPRLVRGPFEAHRLPGVTHLLRTEAAKRGLRGYREQSRRPVDPRVASAILAWLQGITD